MSTREELILKVESLQNMLISSATGGKGDNEEYARLRRELISLPDLKDKLPRFVHTCRDLHQFWTFIKSKYSTWAERRQFLWSVFAPIMAFLERESIAPSDMAITEQLKQVDSAAVQSAWSRALSRRIDDPQGAITAARSLLESVCKFILDSKDSPYEDNIDLPKLYRQTSVLLDLAPSQHSEQILKQVLGGMTAAVVGLGALRNKLGDAHGKGKNFSEAESRHAELAVNLAGTISTFLVATYEAHSKGGFD